ncbi:MAG: hypothetical protein K8T90_18705 [Planctomycetes bacterium]|nr:hypothetical protein [Planctomycetota bacterium]
MEPPDTRLLGVAPRAARTRAMVAPPHAGTFAFGGPDARAGAGVGSRQFPPLDHGFEAAGYDRELLSTPRGPSAADLPDSVDVARPSQGRIGSADLGEPGSAGTPDQVYADRASLGLTDDVDPPGSGSPRWADLSASPSPNPATGLGASLAAGLAPGKGPNGVLQPGASPGNGANGFSGVAPKGAPPGIGAASVIGLLPTTGSPQLGGGGGGAISGLADASNAAERAAERADDTAAAHKAATAKRDAADARHDETHDPVKGKNYTVEQRIQASESATQAAGEEKKAADAAAQAKAESDATGNAETRDAYLKALENMGGNQEQLDKLIAEEAARQKKYEQWASERDDKATARDERHGAKKATKQALASARNTRDKNTATKNAISGIKSGSSKESKQATAEAKSAHKDAKKSEKEAKQAAKAAQRAATYGNKDQQKKAQEKADYKAKLADAKADYAKAKAEEARVNSDKSSTNAQKARAKANSTKATAGVLRTEANQKKKEATAAQDKANAAKRKKKEATAAQDEASAVKQESEKQKHLQKEADKKQAEAHEAEIQASVAESEAKTQDDAAAKAEAPPSPTQPPCTCKLPCPSGSYCVCLAPPPPGPGGLPGPGGGGKGKGGGEIVVLADTTNLPQGAQRADGALADDDEKQTLKPGDSVQSVPDGSGGDETAQKPAQQDPGKGQKPDGGGDKNQKEPADGRGATQAAKEEPPPPPPPKKPPPSPPPRRRSRWEFYPGPDDGSMPPPIRPYASPDEGKKQEPPKRDDETGKRANGDATKAGDPPQTQPPPGEKTEALSPTSSRTTDCRWPFRVRIRAFIPLDRFWFDPMGPIARVPPQVKDAEPGERWIYTGPDIIGLPPIGKSVKRHPHPIVHGDGRGFSSNPDDGTHRVMISVDAAPADDKNWLGTREKRITTGESKVTLTSGKTAEAQLKPSADSWNADSKWPKGGVFQFDDDGVARYDSDAVVHATGSFAIPVDPNTGEIVESGISKAPAIDFEINVKLIRMTDGSFAVVVAGKHDGFPAYEVLVSINCGPWFPAYQYHPLAHDRTPLSLMDLDLGLNQVDANQTTQVDSSGRPKSGKKQ